MSKNSRAHNRARKQKAKSGNRLSPLPGLSRRNSRHEPEVLELVKYEITWDAVDEVLDQSLSDDDAERINTIGEKVLRGQKSRKLLAEIESAIKEFPGLPKLFNYKTVVLTRMNRWDEVEGSIRETVERFPDYLFGKVNYCQHLLEDGRIDEVDRILGGEFRIDRHLGGRTQLHISEFCSWYCLMVRYWIAKDNLEHAARYLDILEEIAPDRSEVDALRQKYLRAMLESSLSATP